MADASASHAVTLMGEPRHHSDPEEGPSPKPRSKAKSKSSRTSKQEERRHRAIEKVINKARQATPKAPPPSSLSPPTQASKAPSPAGPSPVPTTTSAAWSPDRLSTSCQHSPVTLDPLFQSIPISEAQPPMALSSTSGSINLGPPTPVISNIQLPDAITNLITETIRQSVTQCLSQVPTQPKQVTHKQKISQVPLVTEDSSSDQEQEMEVQASLSDEELLGENSLSEDEGLEPDQPAFIGLFKPQMFRSLLFKAQNTTRLGTKPMQGPQSESDPTDALFLEPATATDTVPAPKLL